MDSITASAQGHHRIAFIHAAALVRVEVGLVEAHQAQVKTELFVLFQRGQPSRLLIPGVAHQLVDQQKAGGTRELLTDLLHVGNQQQRLPVQLAEDARLMRAGLVHHHLTTAQAVARAAVQPGSLQRFDAQWNAEQAPPHRHGATPLDVDHRREVIGHQAEGALRQALTVLIDPHFVKQLQRTDAEQRDEHQHRKHAAINAQED